MDYVDKTLQCVECGGSFVFSADEQELFANRGFTNEPKRCPQCRGARRQQRGDGDGYGYQRREMHDATCAACGKDCQVPFEPRQGRPVYCSDCYGRMKR